MTCSAGFYLNMQVYRLIERKKNPLVCDCFNLDSEGNRSDGESLVICITLTDMSLKAVVEGNQRGGCLMCYDVNRYTLHSISIAQNNKALCLQFMVQRLFMFSAHLNCVNKSHAEN